MKVLDFTRPVIVYHRKDPDGWFSNAVCRHHLRQHGAAPETIRSIGWEYRDPTPDVGDASVVFLVDISCEGLQSDPAMADRLVWIDHHISAIKQWGETLPGLRVDGVGACRLAWHWWTRDPLAMHALEPPRVDWAKQQEGEPYLVFLVGLRDAWRHVGTEHEGWCEAVCLGLYSPTAYDMEGYLGADGYKQGMDLASIIRNASVLGQYLGEVRRQDALEAGMLRFWEGILWLCLNTQARGSGVLTEAALRAGVKVEGLCVWSVNAKGRCAVRMYHAPGHEHLDLSKIATARGGGGHRGACGFETDPAEWLNSLTNTRPLVVV